MGRKHILADHADYRITLLQAGNAPAARVVVSFGGQPSDLSDVGFGSSFALENGWDNIFVAQRHGTQYQGLSLQDFRAAVQPVIQGRDAITYGASLGGYCALYYGGVIDARILAAAPMLPAWKPLRIRRYADLEIRHLELAQAPRSSRSPVVLFDPERRQDHFLVNRMVRPAYPDVRLVRIPFAGHTVLLTLAEMRCLKPLIRGIIERDEIVPFQHPDPRHSVWHMENARKLMRTDRGLAIRHLEASLAIKPSKQAFSMLVSALLGERRTDDLRRLLDQSKAAGDKALTPVPAVQRELAAAGLPF
ncbi:hypothetical protein SAMN04488021_12026 [Paracoccus aminovorans]|uniref:Alpha/beta hydrolase family protein n=1 Tax=Paracoccus aminovorans TaxID=34004 RepID=A0A1I3B9B0_9RHOB|nr:hypothetical protein [Paracoccus aminovorans]CQR85400.1 hypothetical protein JCM7685_0821 [Paracoccus aminovorans]SFH58676.1 hypothetical protein SAMN04488021_12026 [Paracoccus aminovorans]